MQRPHVVDLDGVSYITIQGIEFSGGNAGIRIGTADHMFIYDNHIHDTGDVGIPVNSGHTSYLYFVQNHIHDTGGVGEGFYIGANFGAVISHHTYVVGNYVHDTSTTGQGDGIEIKDGSYACVVSDNLVVNTDSDQIIVASADSSQTGLPKLSYTAGGLEDPNIRQQICEILEGGQEAFLVRARRYGVIH